jgi:hypothetical protein
LITIACRYLHPGRVAHYGETRANRRKESDVLIADLTGMSRIPAGFVGVLTD